MPAVKDVGIALVMLRVAADRPADA